MNSVSEIWAASMTSLSESLPLLIRLAIFFVLFGIFLVARKRLVLAASRVDHSAPWIRRVMADVSQHVSTVFLLGFAFWLSFLATSLSDEWISTRHRVLIVSIIWQISVWSASLVGLALERWFRLSTVSGSTSGAALGLMTIVGRVIVWALALLLILDNLGIDVTTLIAGLGVGGVAVALAVQNILGDLFASLSIILDRPFEVGDFIVVGDFKGNVERIGIKTTRVRSLSGEQLIFSNSDLLSSRIRNFKRMKERRVDFSIGVTYETAIDKLAEIPNWAKEIIEESDSVRFDRAHFRTFGDFALVFEVVYFVLDRDMNLYLNTQQRINLELMKRFQEQGVEFAYPTQVVHLASGKLQVEQKTDKTDLAEK